MPSRRGTDTEGRGHRGRAAWAPRTCDQLPRHLQVLAHPQSCRAVAVPPAGTDEHRAGDSFVGGPQRAVPPVRSVVLLTDPLDDPRRGRLDPLAPGAIELRAALAQRRHGVHSDHRRRIGGQAAGVEGAAVEVHVVGVAVVRRVDRRDRAQRGRPLRRQLDARKAAVRDAPRGDRTGAPRLGGDPLHDLDPVELLAMRVLIFSNTCRATGSADVQPHDAKPASTRKPSGTGPRAPAGRPCGRGCAPGSPGSGPSGVAGRRRRTGGRRPRR